MVKRRPYRSILVALLLVAGTSLVMAGCFGGDDGTELSAGSTQTQQSSGTTTTWISLDGLTTAEADALSTFRSKDPFIPQALPPSEDTGTTPGGGTATTAAGGGPTTTAYQPTIIVPTTLPPTTTTKVTSTTTTTAPHLHALKVLSVGTVGGAPAVTFKVDSSVYKDRRVGDVVSTTWGQIKVLDISASSKVVTLLHGSETLVLAEGQAIYE